jgi:hypothetical protein
MYVECLRSGVVRAGRSTQTMNGAKPAAAESGVYFSSLTKKQFLNLHVNALAYGLIQQPDGPKPLEMSQIVRLADAIERLDPNRPESLETAALIHFKAGNVDRAVEIIRVVVQRAEAYGAPDWVLSHYRKMKWQYRHAMPDRTSQ